MRFFRTLLVAILAGGAVPNALAATDSATPKAPEAVAAKEKKEKLEQIVPGATVMHSDGNEFEVVTTAKTAIEIEFTKDGKIEEAEGNAAGGGDVLIPGQGLVSLAEAVNSLKGAGKSPTGEWSLEETLFNDWVYKFEGRNENKKMEYLVSAKDGKYLKERRDW